MSNFRVLISDELSSAAVKIFKDHGIDVTRDPSLGKDPGRLMACVADYDALAVRSATQVTKAILEKAKGRLKVIGRAGIGVDNIDVASATTQGVVVMNTPFGNSVTTAEHALALLFSLARQIPEANASTHSGKWEKKRFMGVELAAKTLGLIGCGNIGSAVAQRAIGLKMKVVAYDPFLSIQQAKELGVERVDLDVLLACADFITLHVPLTEKTANILSKEALAKTRKGVRIINCARGGLVDEFALAEAIREGHVAGAALDVFDVEPAKSNPLFGLENVICTPHLGAATAEAQEKVALEIAAQISDYLRDGVVANAVNFPSVASEELTKLNPYIDLAQKLGAFLGQLAETSVLRIRIGYEGKLSELNVTPVTAAVVSGVLKAFMPDVNRVNAMVSAQQRGVAVDETRSTKTSVFENRLFVQVETEDKTRSAAGTVFQDLKPRIIEVKGVSTDAPFSPHMLYVRNQDKPGFIGQFGALLEAAGINIATFSLGREGISGGEAVCIVAIDEKAPDDLLERIAALPRVNAVKRLSF